MKYIAKKSFAMVPAMASIVKITKELKNPGHVDKGEELTIGKAEQFSDLTPMDKQMAAQLMVTGSIVEASNKAEVAKIEAELKAEAVKAEAVAKANSGGSLEEKIASAVTAALVAAGVGTTKAAK